ncbi:MAG: hypothetical protein H0U75_07250 [Legionella sp.]|nr:hypothetical protein [Legionella sp.]
MYEQSRGIAANTTKKNKPSDLKTALRRALTKRWQNSTKVIKLIADAVSVDLNESDIGPHGAKTLAGALEFNTSLRLLNLSGNRIGDEGAIVLAEALKVNSSLRVLKLTGSAIGYKGIKALADALVGNTTLLSLDLTNNKICLNSIKILIHLLADNHSLLHLGLIVVCPNYAAKTSSSVYSLQSLSYGLSWSLPYDTLLQEYLSEESLYSKKMDNEEDSVDYADRLYGLLKRNKGLQLATASSMNTTQITTIIQKVTMLPLVITDLIAEFHESLELQAIREQMELSIDYFNNFPPKRQESSNLSEQPAEFRWLLADIPNPYAKKKDWRAILGFIKQKIENEPENSKIKDLKKIGKILASDACDVNKVRTIKNIVEGHQSFRDTKCSLFISSNTKRCYAEIADAISGKTANNGQ